VEFLFAGVAAVLILLAVIQLAFLWTGKGAVETAAHFAARRFALSARRGVTPARSAALAEASLLCRLRPAAGTADTALTTLEVTPRTGGCVPSRASSGDAFELRLTHWVELVVPLANRVLFELAPGDKTRLGTRYYVAFRATRWVTVE